jgi:hypothetical protein
MTSNSSITGQPHDRLTEHGVRLGEPETGDNEIAISLYQKMLSATLGSLVTSLLGKTSAR